jgi:hypothetical protein
MGLKELAELSASVLVSLGGSGAILLGLSNWFGKLWAERLMEKERARYQLALEGFKAQLDRESDLKGQTLREKLALYKDVIPPIVDLITLTLDTPQRNSKDAILEFERKRLATTALLGMFAPLPVFEAYNVVIDYLFDCLDGKGIYNFSKFRVLSFEMLSAIRQDIGISEERLIYKGPRQ